MKEPAQRWWESVRGAWTDTDRSALAALGAVHHIPKLIKRSVQAHSLEVAERGFDVNVSPQRFAFDSSRCVGRCIQNRFPDIAFVAVV